jgi:hypothetical protein
MASEIWRPVVGFEELYEVSDHGNVRSVDRWVASAPTVRRPVPRIRHFPGRALKPHRNSKGYLLVPLSRNGVSKSFRIHRLVLIAFVGDCPEGQEGCHLDGNPANNHLSNLRWGTASDNTRDKIRHGRHRYANRTHCERGHEFTSENTRLRTNGGRECLTCKRCRRMEETKVSNAGEK